LVKLVYSAQMDGPTKKSVRRSAAGDRPSRYALFRRSAEDAAEERGRIAPAPTAVPAIEL
jgi:hypothetical protein